MIRRLIATLSVAVMLVLPSLTLVSTQTASAVDVFGACGSKAASNTAVCQERTKTGNPVVKAIRVAIDILAIVIGVCATIVIILSAFKMVRSNGNPQEVSTARTGIIYAAIGLVIAILAPIIVGYVLKNV